jgi:hypothetical protein
MTQELILGALLVGIIGLVWALTCAILNEDRRAPDARQSVGVHQSSNPEVSDKTALPHRNVA